MALDSARGLGGVARNTGLAEICMSQLLMPDAPELGLGAAWLRKIIVLLLIGRDNKLEYLAVG